MSELYVNLKREDFFLDSHKKKTTVKQKLQVILFGLSSYSRPPETMLNTKVKSTTPKFYLTKLNCSSDLLGKQGSRENCQTLQQAGFNRHDNEVPPAIIPTQKRSTEV